MDIGKQGRLSLRAGKTVDEVLLFAREAGVQIVDYKFVDIPGKWQHKSVPVSQLEAKTFTEGTGFDGSSIRGFQEIEDSDMLLLPDASTAFLDPFMDYNTLSLTCNIAEPGAKKAKYSKDARHIAQQAEKYLAGTGIADTSYWGPELEFFIFDSINYKNDMHQARYRIDSQEGAWNTDQDDPNQGYKIRAKEGYFPVPPNDRQQDIRSDMVLTMEQIGVPIETHHHEVATAGQAEIDMVFDSLTNMADKVLMYKYVVKNIAHKHGKTATFMPKPLFGDNGSGMHTHQSLWKDGKPLFYDPDGYSGLSQMALYYIGGILDHAHSLMAFAAPTTNSYKRLVPGYEAPVNIAYSARNRSAAIRIPTYEVGSSTAAKRTRIEFRSPDPMCNPYLAFPAMLLAGLDGIKRKIDPSKAGYGPLEKNIYKLTGEEKKNIKSMPGSLEQSLAALESDHDYLLQGSVFPKHLIEEWIDYKRKAEADPVRIRPHPYEFELYYDA